MISRFCRLSGFAPEACDIQGQPFCWHLTAVLADVLSKLIETVILVCKEEQGIAGARSAGATFMDI